MAAAHTVLERASGSAGPYSICLRRIGEGLQLVSLSEHAGPATASVDEEASAFIFTAPRAGADRYPDWADFEQSCRYGTAGESRVWRIAEDGSRACFLAQNLASRGPRLPVAAALWRGWVRPVTAARALLWQSEEAAHLWLVQPERFPTYERVRGRASVDELLQLLYGFLDRRDFTLEMGGVHADVRTELSGWLCGTVTQVEPFSRFQVTVSLREKLCALDDHTVYLPAVGAALSLLEGPPQPLALCASSPAAAAGVD